MAEKVKTSINIDKDVYDYLKKISDDEQRSFSKQLTLLVKKYIMSNTDLRAAQ